MLPLQLKSSTRVCLIGAGDKLAQRQLLLATSGITPSLYADGTQPDAAAFEQQRWQIVYIIGLPEDISQTLAEAARTSGALVNVEDMPTLCDFYVPAIVRRGDLLVTVSTGGRASGLSKILREYLEETVFPPVWQGRLQELVTRRQQWRSEGLRMDTVMTAMRRYVREQGWLP